MNRSPANIILIITGLSGFLWVLIGAMTGHEPMSSPYANYMEKAQRYHIIHTLVCLYLTLTIITIRRLIATIAFFAGMLCFSGSLYLMAVYHWSLNFMVPVGGIAFLIGWLALVYDAIISKWRTSK